MKWNKFIVYVLTALAIFAQGLYFSEQWLLALIIISFIYVTLIYKDGHLKWSRTFLSYWLLFYVVLHAIGYGFFQEKGMLIFALLKSCLYLIFYLVLIQLKDKGLSRSIKEAYVISMVIAGYLTTFIFVTGWLDGLNYVINGRGSGPIQYANTFGILLVAALMLLSDFHTKVWVKFLGSIGLVMPLLLTMSRGNYAVAFVMLLLVIIIARPSKATLAALATSIVIGVIVLVVFDHSETAQRLTQATGSSEWHSRLLYYRDAIKMILSKPLGYGPNGYHYAQSFYQTGSTYHVKFVHSGLVQQFLDLGVVGGLLIAVLMFYSVFLGGHSWMNRLLLMALLGHSLIDMNLQFPVVWLLIIVLLSEVKSPTVELVGGKGKLLIGTCVVTLCLACTMMLPTIYAARGHYKKAVNLYPYYTEAYRMYLNQQGYEEGLVTYAERLEQLNPYVTEAYPILRDAAIQSGDYEAALIYSEKMVTYSPLLIEHHEQYSHALMLAATYWHAYGEDGQALEALAIIRQIPGSLEKLAKEKNTDYNVKHKPALMMNDALMKDYNEASYLMNKINEGQD